MSRLVVLIFVGNLRWLLFGGQASLLDLSGRKFLLFLELPIVGFNEATLAKELPLAQHADDFLADVDLSLGEASLSGDTTYLLVDDASHTAFGLLALEKLAYALLLDLVWNARLDLSKSLKLAFTHNKDVIVRDALML